MHLFFCQYAWEQAWVFWFVNMLGFDHDHLYCLWPKWSGKIMVYQYVRLQFGPFPLLAWLQGYDLRWLFSSVWVTFLAFLMGLVHKLRKASPVFCKVVCLFWPNGQMNITKGWSSKWLRYTIIMRRVHKESHLRKLTKSSNVSSIQLWICKKIFWGSTSKWLEYCKEGLGQMNTV